MYIKCIYSSIGELPISKKIKGASNSYCYSITKEKNYVVYGILTSDRIDCLINDDNGFIYWIPINMFEIIDDEIPPNWVICSTQLNKDFSIYFEQLNIISIIGYHKLATSPNHFSNIIEREPEDMAILQNEKVKIDKWSAERYHNILENKIKDKEIFYVDYFLSKIKISMISLQEIIELKAKHELTIDEHKVLFSKIIIALLKVGGKPVKILQSGKLYYVDYGTETDVIADNIYKDWLSYGGYIADNPLTCKDGLFLQWSKVDTIRVQG